MLIRISSIQRLIPVEEKDLVYRNAFGQAQPRPQGFSLKK